MDLLIYSDILDLVRAIGMQLTFARTGNNWQVLEFTWSQMVQNVRAPFDEPPLDGIDPPKPEPMSCFNCRSQCLSLEVMTVDV